MPPTRLAVVLTLAALFLSACSLKDKPKVDLARIYNDAAMRHGPEQNPVILIPGILGSKLRDTSTGTLVWGAFEPGVAKPTTPEGARLIALPMEMGVPLVDLEDGVVPDGVLDRLEISFVPGLRLAPKAYMGILETLGTGGYRDQGIGGDLVDYGPGHFTCFQFPYDWRRTTAENAAALDVFIKEKADYVAGERLKRYGTAGRPVRFDLVAHSVGSLIARYYLRYGGRPLPADGSLPPLTWAGAKHVENAVMVAPPNAGSITSLYELTHGLDFPLLPEFSPALIGTMPSVYELLPRARHGILTDPQSGARLDPLGPAVWEARGWGLAADTEELRWLLPDVPTRAGRLAIARDHLRKCLANAEQLQRALDRPAASHPPGLHLSLYAGDAIETAATATATTGNITIISYWPGDFIVPRYSALMDERTGDPVAQRFERLRSPIPWDDVTFIHADHLGITRDPTFTDTLLYQLLER